MEIAGPVDRRDVHHDDGITLPGLHDGRQLGRFVDLVEAERALAHPRLSVDETAGDQRPVIRRDVHRETLGQGDRRFLEMTVEVVPSNVGRRQHDVLELGFGVREVLPPGELPERTDDHLSAHAIGDEPEAFRLNLADDELERPGQLLTGRLGDLSGPSVAGEKAPLVTRPVEYQGWITVLKQAAMLGLELHGPTGQFFTSLATVVRALPALHPMTALVGVAGLIALLAARRLSHRVPAPLVVLAISVLLVWWLDLGAAGVALLGQTTGSARFGLPTDLETSQVIGMVPGALAIVVLGLTQSIGAMKRSAEQTGERIDPDRELLAIGMSNVGASVSGGYAVCGTLGKTAVAIASGGRTQVGNLFAGVLGVLAILFLLPLLANLADATLAAIVVVAMLGLSDIGYFRLLWRVRPVECALGVVATLAVLVLGVLNGVVIGVMLALFIVGNYIRRPRTSRVGRLPSGAFVDLEDHEEAEEIPGMLISRQYAPVVFLNARNPSNRLRETVLARDDLRVVVIDATASSGLDSTATAAFLTVRDDLREAGVALWVVNIQEDTWRRIVTTLEARGLPLLTRFDSLEEAVGEFERHGAPPG